MHVLAAHTHTHHVQYVHVYSCRHAKLHKNTPLDTRTLFLNISIQVVKFQSDVYPPGHHRRVVSQPLPGPFPPRCGAPEPGKIRGSAGGFAGTARGFFL